MSEEKLPTECPVCLSECSKDPMDPKAPVLPLLQSGKCCRHVYCKSCITEWLLTRPLRSPTRFRPDGTFERMEVPCPMCGQPIKGLWPVLCGQVQTFEVKWGTDDLNLDLDDEVVIISPSEKKDIPYLRGSTYTRGYFFDGPERKVEEVTIEDDMEPSDAETTTDAAVIESGGNFSGGSSSAVDPNRKKVSRKTTRKPAAKTYRCEPCGLEYQTRGGLKNHVDGIHKRVTYPCEQCGINYTRLFRLQNHMKEKHQ